MSGGKNSDFLLYCIPSRKKRSAESEKMFVPVIVDRNMREQIPHTGNLFPISFFENELSELPDRAGPMHWHPDFELARAEVGALDYQVGQTHLLLQAGDSLLVNRNLLHCVRQVDGDLPDPMPVVVFSGSLVAPEDSVIYQKYIAPVADCDCLPFVVFRQQEDWCKEIRCLVEDLVTNLRQRKACYEMAVQRDLNRLFELLFCHFEALPKARATRIQLRTQVRVQKMLAYMYTHYAQPITIDDIAKAASVSPSEAARCFHEYMDCAPVAALIRYRLQTAHRMLHDTSMSVQEIGLACGFRSANYFSRQFRQTYGYTPGQVRKLGK